jgi:hypothetical protein
MAAPALATHGGIHPKFKSQNVYFHCTGDTPVQNVNFLASNGSSAAHGRWDTSPPPGSVTDGNGCMGGDMGGASFGGLDASFEGTFNGNLRDLTVRIYDFILNNDRDPGVPARIRVYAELDGSPIFPGGTAENPSYAGRAVTVSPTRENSGLTDQFEFSITNLGFANEIKDAAGNVIDVETGGAAIEDGNGTLEHTLTLYIGHDAAVGGDPQTTGADFFVWDTSEVPSGITFNPPTLAAATVQADIPSS